MKIFVKGYKLGILILLMFIRSKASGDWFGSIVVLGVFVALMDLTTKLIASHSTLKDKKPKDRLGFCLVILFIIGFIVLASAFYNIVDPLKWLKDTTILDELTLLALLLSISQDTVLDILNAFIGKDIGE